MSPSLWNTSISSCMKKATKLLKSGAPEILLPSLSLVWLTQTHKNSPQVWRFLCWHGYGESLWHPHFRSWGFRFKTVFSWYNRKCKWSSLTKWGAEEGLLFSRYRKRRVQGSCSCSGSFWGLFCILYLLWLYAHGCKMEAAPPGRSTFPGVRRTEGKRPKRANEKSLFPVRSVSQSPTQPLLLTLHYLATSTCKGHWAYCHCQHTLGTVRGKWVGREEGGKEKRKSGKEREKKQGGGKKEESMLSRQPVSSTVVSKRDNMRYLPSCSWRSTGGR